MIVTGIAHPPARLLERSELPSAELIHLAKKAMAEYGATHLITSLALGWEQALTKAALEMEIPYTVAIPYPGRDSSWGRKACILYLDLLARASEVYRISDCYSETAVLEGHFYRVDQAETILALWDYDFQGDTFRTIDYALKMGKTVANLWKEWQQLRALRKIHPNVGVQDNKIGAQIFDSRS
jgi:uncharacterized phage-like protein YoqJ